MTMKPAHRDDIPPEVIEEMERRFPGMKIVCVGDRPVGSDPSEADEAIGKLEQDMARSLCEGVCLNCGKQMPGFPQCEEDWDAWQPPKGWGWIEDSDGNPMHWECPECHKKLDDGIALPCGREWRLRFRGFP